jgi:purine-nucleoside phosphorylase
MYKQFPKEDYLKRFGFPSNYEVEGILIYGTWKKKYYEIFKENLSKLNINFESKFVEYPFLNSILECRINGKNYWFMIAYGGAMLSEHLHIGSLFGSKKNILLGSCGGLQKEGSQKDIIFPLEVFGEESSAKLYSENKNNLYSADINLTKNLQKRLGDKHKFFEGKTVTCQAMLGETWEDVVSWSNQGYLAVEMEASTVFAVSNHFKVPCAAMVMIGDNLIMKETVWDEEHKKGEAERKNVQSDMFDIAILELLNL